jgi:DnaJ domain.
MFTRGVRSDKVVMRAGKKDYYEILGVPRNATKEEIDARFCPALQ